ncbi:MAG: NADH-quinone oxidoreductase subunit I [Candidatus Zixiibacteriota bacterium]|nr:MAG: NADH-quinone oxidoreductase subunit I [candidate division Zixibacteria bacterium]
MKKLVDAIRNLVVGLFTTGKHLGRHAVTLQYPTQKWEMPERSRGIVVLLSDKESGELNCTVCMLCMRACPTGAITIEFEKDEKGKRILKDFIVDNGICCFCGLCEEACNFAAIKMAGKYEFSTEDRETLIWHQDRLQEIGRGVPYEKPVRKKPAAKPAAEPPNAGDGPAAAESAQPEVTAVANPPGDAVITKPGQPAESRPAPEPPARPDENPIEGDDGKSAEDQK